jgi:carbon-monoxide dehydrogenase small subunit
MKQIHLTVNGEPVTALVAPRTSLADFLREELLLTGTHLGCEQGVCGACTIMIDGATARSCIAFAVALDGAEITTIEGFDDDARMAQLRQAFTREHGLQCGFCTPGMMITARDIVLRLPAADDERIRRELSGNLCRCTGYAGIVRAVRAVLGEAPPAESAATTEPEFIVAAAPLQAAAPALPEGASELRQEFEVTHPPDAVWALFRDIETIAGCMPGASLDGPPDGERVAGRIAVKMGPISAAFAGNATVRFDDAKQSGTISGHGRDGATGSGVRGEVRFALTPSATGTHVEITVGYAITGMLGQFARAGIVNAVAARLTADFAANLQARLDGFVAASGGRALSAGSLLLGMLWSAIKRLVGRG